jgi:23S rRNA pseudouridine1911/1915/1917 synthase
MTQLEVTIKDEKGRLDKVLAEKLTDYSRSQVQQWLKEDAVTLDNQPVKANYKVKAGNHFTITIPEPVTLDLVAEDIPLDIVYQDEDVAVINKPQGMVVHPSAGHPNGTLVNALLYHLKDLSSINDVVRPGIVHRIDKDTSGLLMVAKNDAAHEFLAKQLKDKTSLRKYIALVHGNIAHEKGTINAPIAKCKQSLKKGNLQ